MRAFLIIGISSGLGKDLFHKISKDYFTIGITSKKELEDKNILFYLLNVEQKDQIKNLEKIKKILDNYKKYQFNIIFNSAIYDKKNDTIEDKKNILNINFFNQMFFYEYLVKKLEIKVSKLIFFSSFEAVKKYSNMQYYRLSKIMYIDEFYKITQNVNSPCVKLFVFGGIKTESYYKNSKMKKNMITKNLPKDVNSAVNFILKKISTNKSEIIYYPKYYYYLHSLLKLIKKS